MAERSTRTRKPTEPKGDPPEDEPTEPKADDPPAPEPEESGALTVGATGDAVLDAQRKLNAAGMRVEQNGRFTPKLAASISSFQARSGLAVTGTLDAATLDALDG